MPSQGIHPNVPEICQHFYFSNTHRRRDSNSTIRCLASLASSCSEKIAMPLRLAASSSLPNSDSYLISWCRSCWTARPFLSSESRIVSFKIFNSRILSSLTSNWAWSSLTFKQEINYLHFSKISETIQHKFLVNHTFTKTLNISGLLCKGYLQGTR